MRNSGGAWILALLSIGALGALYGWKGGQTLLFLLTLLLLVSIQGAIAWCFGPKQVKVHRTWFPIHPRVGDHITVTLTIELSGRFLPAWLEVEDMWSRSAGSHSGQSNVSLVGKLALNGWKKNYTGTYTIEYPDRGIFQGNYVLISWGDYFGWFKRYLRVATNDALIIHPAPLSVEPEKAGASHQDDAGQQMAKADMLFQSFDPGRLRAYAAGDPLRAIHWKSSAKKGTLLTRISETEEELTRCLLLDTNREAYAVKQADDAFELAIQAAAAWLIQELGRSNEICIRPGRQHSSEPGGGKSMMLAGGRAIKSGLDLLAGLQPVNAGLSGAELLKSAAMDPVYGKAIFTLITGALTQEVVEVALHLKERGIVVEIWFMSGIGSNKDTPRLVSLLRESGLPFIDLTHFADDGSFLQKGGADDVIA